MRILSLFLRRCTSFMSANVIRFKQIINFGHFCIDCIHHRFLFGLMLRKLVLAAERRSILYINWRSVRLSVCINRSLPPADQPWQMKYQEKAHNPSKIEIIFSRPYILQVFS